MSFECDDSSLMALKFVSTPDATLSSTALNLVVCQAWAHNMRAGITGEIALRDGMFHQVLEGSFDELVPLASRILSDPRHHHITIDHFGSIPARMHRSWACIGFETLLPQRMPRDPGGPVVCRLPDFAPQPREASHEHDLAAATLRIY